MSNCKAFIIKLQRMLPDLAKPRDLVKIGLYRTEQAAYVARKKGTCPPYFRIPCHGIVYPRQGVIDFVKSLETQNDCKPNVPNGLISNPDGSRISQNQKDMPR